VTWFAFRGYPAIDVAGIQEKELVSLGFHGYATQAQAQAAPNSVGWWQKAQLNTMEADYAYAKAAGEQPGGPNATLTPGNVAAGAGQAAVSGLSGQLQVTGISGWFFRGMKIVFGGVLLVLGISKLTGASNTIVTLAGKVPVIP
jgi:hypothetical protein